MSSPVDIDNKGKDVLIFGEGPTQGFDDTTLTAEAIYLINFWRSQRKFCLSLCCNWSNSFLFVNATKIYQFKENDSEIKTDMIKWKKAGLNGYVYEFSVDYNIIDTSKIIGIPKI